MPPPPKNDQDKPQVEYTIVQILALIGLVHPSGSRAVVGVSFVQEISTKHRTFIHICPNKEEYSSSLGGS